MKAVVCLVASHCIIEPPRKKAESNSIIIKQMIVRDHLLQPAEDAAHTAAKSVKQRGI